MLIDETLIYRDTDFQDKNDLLNVVSSRLFEQGYVKKSYIKAIVDRENTFPTGLQLSNYNVAIPHTDGSHVKEAKMAICILDNPIKFNRMDDVDQTIYVKVVFILALPEKSHMNMLTNVIELIQDHDFILNIKERSNNEIIEHISQKMEVESYVK